ncbi:MAG: heme-binding domain-containing protein [Myxococcales bacterium]|nr:heme-binding domain-containing protein [Myxococcales bacterium]
MTRNRLLATLALGLVVLVTVASAAGPRVHNPPVTQEPAWDSPRTRELAKRACFDCHSNQVEVPVYGYIAPFSWIVADHVEEGRERLNFSEMDRPQKEAHEAGEVVQEGEMPPAYYTALHPGARLTAAETRELAAGLAATLGGEGGESHARAGGYDDDDGDDD